MKKLSFLLVLLFAASAFSADVTAPVNTANFQTFNQSYRSVGDGTNAQTGDSITADTYAHIGTGAPTLIKSSGGYLDNITFETLCNGTSAYVLADSATSGASYAVVITTIPQVTGTVPINIPFHLRFNNGLAINVTPSTCTAVVSYR